MPINSNSIITLNKIELILATDNIISICSCSNFYFSNTVTQ